jgi:hypothetical protein
VISDPVMTPYHAPDSIGDREVFTNHLSHLTPGHKYYFYIQYNTGEKSRIYSFKTPNPKKGVKLINGGNVGHSMKTFDMATVAAQEKPDLILIGGNVAFDEGFPECY